MKQKYLRLVRRSYRFVRHPKLKNNPLFGKLLKTVFDRTYWQPNRRRVARGLSIGLFFSMILIPGQTIGSLFTALKLKANIPIALAACWVTNPMTMLPVMVAQEWIGKQILGITNCRTPDFLKQANFKVFLTDLDLNVANFLVGIVISAICMGALAYPIVYTLAALFPHKKG